MSRDSDRSTPLPILPRVLYRGPALPVRPFETFVRTCITLATATDAFIDILPTLYFRDGETWSPLVVPRNGKPIVREELVATMREALRDLAIDPDIDAYCAVHSLRIRSSDGRSSNVLALHAGERRPQVFGEVRLYGIDEMYVDAEPFHRRDEPSWFAGLELS